MPILREILKWSANLPGWQSDAIARLFAKGTLSVADHDDLFAILKAENGIPDHKGRKANKLSAGQIPTPTIPKTHMRIALERATE